MKLRYQYRIYPTQQQQYDLARLFGCCRVVYNDALALCKASEKLPSNGDLQKICITQAKKTGSPANMVISLAYLNNWSKAEII